MHRRFVFPVVALAVAYARTSHAQDISRALDIERAIRASAPRVSWPGFNPMAIPLAIYDGESTVLIRHPSPPAGFRPASIDTAVMVMNGRHAAVTANSSAVIGGRMTATIMVDGRHAAASTAALAAVAVHEMFHVFQRERHKGWVGNEGDLLTYPVHDARRLAMRRLETDALRRAQGADAAEVAACWARAYLALRSARYAGLDTAFIRYERLTELNEGLANYVQAAAAEEPRAVFPVAEFPPAAVRLRIYTTGPAIARLLDRFAPHWKEALEGNDAQSLDGMLREALPAPPAPPATCGHSREERDAARQRAEADSAAIVSGRTERRAAFDALPGWRLVVRTADNQPLWPQGFDPLNVEHVAGGMLHTRYLKLGGDAGSVEVLDEAGVSIEAVTVAAGAHPLFNGVRELTVVGFQAPELRDSAGVATINARGLKLSLRGAVVRQVGQTLEVSLAPRPQ